MPKKAKSPKPAESTSIPNITQDVSGVKPESMPELHEIDAVIDALEDHIHNLTEQNTKLSAYLSDSAKRNFELGHLLESILSGSIFSTLQITNYDPARVSPGSAEHIDLINAARELSDVGDADRNILRESALNYIRDRIALLALQSLIKPFIKESGKSDVSEFVLAFARLLGVREVSRMERHYPLDELLKYLYGMIPDGSASGPHKDLLLLIYGQVE